MARRPDIPLVAIVGRSDTGKTTLVEALVAELARRGRRVATVKHHPAATELDTPGTDSWRHARAGAVVSMLSTPDALATVERTDTELGLEELRGRAADAEILLAEGFARGEHPRIEVMGDAANPDPRCAPEDVIAIVASSATNLDRYDAVPRFEPDDTAGIADFIEGRFLEAGGGTAGN